MMDAEIQIGLEKAGEILQIVGGDLLGILVGPQALVFHAGQGLSAASPCWVRLEVGEGWRVSVLLVSLVVEFGIRHSMRWP